MKMYVILGNIWLLVALVIILGRTVERTEPALYSFFGLGGWFYPLSYHAIVIVCVVIALAHFIIAARPWLEEEE